jgi:hypothetical protein
MRYRDERLKFEMTFPKGWKKPGLLHWLKRIPVRLAFASQYITGGPEFYGPLGNSIKLAVGPISPEPTPEEHQRNVKAMAIRHEHRVLDIGLIKVAGKEHATMVVLIPRYPRPLTLKNYFLIFRGIEYVVTASLKAGEETCDEIVRSFRQL